MIIFTPNSVIKSADVNLNFSYFQTPDSDWIVPTLLNSWVNYDPTFNEAGYYKDANGFVHLRGMVKNGSSTIFTLPSGYRVKAGSRIWLMTTQGNSGLGRVDIYPNGNVLYISGGNGWLSLDGLIFKAEA
jgi:hypothetical protein